MKKIFKDKTGKFIEKNFIILLFGIFFVFSIFVFVLAEGGSAGVWMDLSANDTGNWAGVAEILGVAVNTNNNLIYTALGSGKFGVYNHSNGVWMSLSANDTGNWAGIDYLYSVAVNTNDNLVYTGLLSGKFGVYNHSNGVWMSLSANDTGNWAGTDSVYGVAVNTNDNLIYTSLTSGKFGVYNHSNGVWMSLSANDTGNWAGGDNINSVAVNTNDNLVYTGLGSGKFGVYNHSNGVWMNLSGNDTGNWAGTGGVQAVTVNPNNNLVYTGLTSGKFGVYNHSNGIWMDLSGNDTGNWAGTTTVNGVAVNTNDNLVYTGLTSGKFGVYDHSNGVWMDLSGNDTGNWAGTTAVYGVAVNPNDNLVYTGLDSGKFGVYNNSWGDTILPLISIALPTNNSFTSDTSQDINFTASDTNINTCWYSNDSYTINTTLANCNTNITTVTWSEGQHNVTVWANDSANNVNSSTVSFTIDTIKPLVDFVSPTPANNSGVNNNFEINVSITELNLVNVTYNWNGTNITYDLTNNASYFAGSAPNWVFNLTQTGLTAGNSYTYYVYAKDNASNSNSTLTRTILGNSVPTFISIDRSPISLENLDPNNLINVTVNISDIESNFDTAFLQWKNTSADWGNAVNVTMLNSTAKGAYTILNASFIPTYEANYSYRIWANDTLGNSSTSSETNISVFWDCTWTATSDLSSTAGWDENKRIGNIIINNTGDSSHSTGCSLDFRLTYDLPEGRIYFDNIYYKPSSTYTLSAKSSQNISVNASFLSEIKSEDVVISTNELLSRTNVSQRNTTATIVSNQAGPYLFQKITSNPQSVYLTAGNFSLEAYIRNLMGSTTVNANNTAYNVTFNWTLPSGITNVSGTYKVNFTNITDSDLHYNNINASFSSLASMTSGVKTFYIYAAGVNKTGHAIQEADGTTLLKKSVNITFLCYATSDSVCVTDCGAANDPDCTTTTTSSTSAGGGGGGSAGGPSAVTGKSVAEYELVRGQEQKFELTIENQYTGYLENLQISVKGIRQDLIKIIPDKIEKIKAGQSKDIVIEIISPAYFTEGHYDLEFLVTGNLITGEEKRPYLGRMKVDLFIIDIPRKEAESMLKESSNMFKQMNNSNMSLKTISGFYISLQDSFEERKFSEVKKSYDKIKTIYDNAFGSLELLEQLQKQIKRAEKNGILVTETKKLMYLGEVAFERGDYESSIKRLEEARLTYALETKGEFNFFYAVKNNPLESTGILFSAILFSFSSFLVTRYNLYKRKLKNLEEEEKLLLELMKTVQRETFENSHFSMGSYREAMFQYETRLSQVIEDKIETETKLASLFKIRGRERALKGEKEKLYTLVKELQKDYLQKGKIETRVYGNMLKIYSTRIVEIEEKLVYIEAKQILHKKYPLKKLKLGWLGI